MAKKLTTLLLIALMLTLPLRAMAGVAMACPMGAQAAMQMQDEMQAAHCQEMHHGEQDDGQPQDGHHAQGGCNLCADCCVGSASLPVSFQFGFADKPHTSLNPLIAHAYTGFQPEGPERPPRSSAL